MSFGSLQVYYSGIVWVDSDKAAQAAGRVIFMD